MNGIHKIGSDGGGTVALTVQTTATNTTATLQAKDGTVALIDDVKGFKNYIINGNFDIWQYKDAGLTHPQTSSGYGSDDRWSNGNSGSTKSHSQVACTDTERALFNTSHFSRTVVASVAGASNYVVKSQSIENITKLAGKTVTLSFWARADSVKNIAIEFGQNFGTGGTPSSSIAGIGSQLISLTNTWQKKAITVTIPSIVGKTLGTGGIHTTANWIMFWFDAGSSFNSRSASLGQQSGTFDIAQVQLEEGSVATPFEDRPYGLELSLCQRYYWMRKGVYEAYGYGVGTSNTSASGGIEFPITMRASPTVYSDSTSLSFAILGAGGGLIGVTSLAFSNQSKNSVFWTATSSLMTGGQATCLMGTLASTYISASAEL